MVGIKRGEAHRNPHLLYPFTMDWHGDTADDRHAYLPATCRTGGTYTPTNGSRVRYRYFCQAIRHY